MKKLTLLLPFLLLWTASTLSFAQTCPLLGATDMTLDPIMIPASLPVGSTVYDRTYTSVITPYTLCRNFPDWVITFSNYSGFVTPPDSNGIAPTSVAGLGVRLTMQYGKIEGILSLKVREGDLPPEGTPFSLRIQLIKTGAITGIIPSNSYVGRNIRVAVMSDFNNDYFWTWRPRFSTVKVVATTCDFTQTNQLVTLGRAPVREFQGIGTTARPTDFNVQIRCAEEDQVADIGLSFDPAYRHASQAAGVIAVDATANSAAGVAIQVVNKTTNLPIQFGRFESGNIVKGLNGTYNYPFTARYYQTDATVRTGTVAGRAVVSVTYR